MFQKLSGRFRNSNIDSRLLIPLLMVTALEQAIAAIVRIATSYRAVELDLSTAWIGVIAAAYSAFPIVMAVQIGRFIDRGNDALTIWIGSFIVAASSAFFLLAPGPVAMLAITAVIGSGHTMLMASQQMLCVRAAKTSRSRESVFGNYMVAGAIGQGLGPYIVGWAGGAATVPPTQLLFLIACGCAVLSLAVALTIRRNPDRPKQAIDEKPVPIADLLRVPGLIPVITAGVIMISAIDIILIYVPLLGTERGIDVKDIGLLLTVRAASAMVARLFYARLVDRVGRFPLMITSTLFAAASFAALSIPMPLYGMYMIMTVMGFAFGIATTLSITIVIHLTEARARGTANTLRIMGNRLGQFAIPFGSGLIATAIGLSGLLGGIAVAIFASATAIYWKRPGKAPPE